MNKNIKIYIAGHRGLVGSAIKREFERKGYTNIIGKTHSELDLTDSKAVAEFFEAEKPDWVVQAAAKVGGILGNSTYPVEFMLENLKIQNNIIENSYKNNVKKLLFLASSCIYPKNSPQPMKEEYLLSDYLEKTNEAYALAKICGIKLCNYYNKEYGTNYMSVMPCNLYGIGDNYHPKNAHVIPMLIRRFHEAKEQNLPETTVWGTGTPRREFMFADDLAEAVVYLMENKDAKDIGEFINIGSGFDMPISQIIELIKETVGYKGKLVYDKTKPDGTMLKLMDDSKINQLGWKAKTELKDGLKIAYNDFLNKFKDIK
ncbi:TPA: GDP-fucose synthetase [Candidatus Gastranaerophilales bacterium HUM_2]|nr:MAG TPA: GDP-fucose synthetase [Candidatus Gastranaerophilales bacterium HUM_2]